MDYLQLLKTEVERRYGRQPESPVDYNELALEIQKATGKNISSYTLMRIWGHVKNTSSPRQDTLSNLARYAGYTGWKEFVSKADALADSAAPSERVSSGIYDSVNNVKSNLRGGTNTNKENKWKKNPTLVLAVAALLILIGVGLGFILRKCASEPPHELVSDILIFDNDTLSWSLDMTTWELTISGNGRMKGFRREGMPEAWLEYRDSLRSVEIGEGITHIGNCAFRDCPLLASISLPESCTSIGNYTFDRCPALTAIVLPERLTSIGGAAFWGCSHLQEIVLPRGVTSIEGELFCYCSGLHSCTILGDIKYIKAYAFAECEALVRINLPEGLKEIETSAFSNCHSLKEIFIPEGVTQIEMCAFHDCSSLQAVTLPSTLTDVGMEAFEYCTALLHIDCHASIAPHLEDDVFIGIPPSTVRLTYPAGADYSSWKTALGI